MLDGERDFGGGQRGIVAIRHQYRAGVAAFTMEHHTIAARPGDMFDKTDGHTGTFEQWALLDVEFDEGVIRTGIEPHRFERFLARAQVFQRTPFRIPKGERFLQRQRSCDQATTKATDAEAGRLFGGEHDDLQ